MATLLTLSLTEVGDWLLRTLLSPFRWNQESWFEVAGKYYFAVVLWGAVVGLATCGLWCLWNGARSRNWPTAPGTVLHSEVQQCGEPYDPSHEVKILYRYEVGGREYVGKRVFFGQGIQTADFARLQRRMSAYAAGCPVQVHFCRWMPSVSVLQPGIKLEAWILAILGVVLLATLLYGVISGGTYPL